MWEKYSEVAEDVVEYIVFASRWLLAPFYVGLAISIVVLLIKFAAELWHLMIHAFTSTEAEVILGVLALVDLALTGSLLIIVIFSGYENFVSKIDHSAHKDWPEWMGTIDFTALKLKLLSSIVAISAIQLLKQFMAIKEITDRDLMWLVVIHVVFVISSVLLALSDRIAAHHGPADAAPHGPAPSKDDDKHEGTSAPPSRI
ncbi:MAG: TIGR00645 family protein [Hyphomicrobiaceae bacterium]|nr:TIGR00645 family protein [Hyphomicrobiaceae bacterium]